MFCRRKNIHIQVNVQVYLNAFLLLEGFEAVQSFRLTNKSQWRTFEIQKLESIIKFYIFIAIHRHPMI